MATAPIESLAKLLDLTPRRVQQLAKEGVIPKPATRGQYDIIPSVVAYIRHLRAVASGDGGDLLTEKTRRSALFSVHLSTSASAMPAI